ncbi:unnamed protein product [Microthlaspi erraticum]|uniref:F-box domain-containing protein n=1 Tax=Microthlaspi erraticum TaxID=1685480 RepID=A0A6D2L5M3_9BRAS|nr:unnamed protein product [Microthlaspi erraticum]
MVLVPPNESSPDAPPPSPTPPNPSLFSSLPEDIVVSVLAHISTSYYPTLCLVSKRFRSLILSEELGMLRSKLGTQEECVYVRLQSRTDPCDHRWFSLWIQPNDIKPLTHWKTKVKCTGNMFLPMPSSYSPRLPIFRETVGSKTYEIGGQNNHFSTDVWVYDMLTGKPRKAPSMTVARKHAHTCSMDGKLYVMGGCKADESTCWAEVFDPNTQTWEPLPDPGTELRYSLLKKVEAHRGNVFVRSNKKNFVYLTKERRWEVIEVDLGESTCEIDNVCYCYNNGECLWFDTKWGQWKPVKGLTWFNRHVRVSTEIRNYGGKLVVVWAGPESYVFLPLPRAIWAAVILVEKRNDGAIWGRVEWEDIVLLLPETYRNMVCIGSLQ